MDRRIHHLKNILAERLDHPWTVEEMASTINLSVSHLLRLFRTHMGVSLASYLSSIRLEMARHMLTDPSNFLRVKEICFLVGFSSESQFSRDFKNMFGISPTRYREESFELAHASSAQN